VSARVFISYRRDGDASQHATGRVYDRLCQDLGEQHVFMDAHKIPLGQDFADYLKQQIAQCDYVLVMIGPQWQKLCDEHGRRRLDDPSDWVRLEVAAALRREIPVVPVLVDGGSLPKANELPDDMKGLVQRQALLLTDAVFRHEMDQLVGQIQRAEGHATFSFDGWSAWGGLQLRRPESESNVLIVSGAVTTTAGVVLDARLPHGGKTLEHQSGLPMHGNAPKNRPRGVRAFFGATFGHSCSQLGAPGY